MPRQPLPGRTGRTGVRAETVLAGRPPHESPSRPSSVSNDGPPDMRLEPLAGDERGAADAGLEAPGFFGRLLSGLRRAVLP